MNAISITNMVLMVKRVAINSCFFNCEILLEKDFDLLYKPIYDNVCLSGY